MLIAARETVRLALLFALLIMKVLRNLSSSFTIQSAILLTFVLYFLSIYPEVTTRLRQELVSEYGRDGILTFEQIQKLPYCKLLLSNYFAPVPHA